MRTRKPRRIALPFGLALVACSEGPVQPPPALPPRAIPVALALVSGDHQEGKAGEMLPEPLTVRATDEAGDPVASVVVRWRLIAGAGVLIDDEGRRDIASTRTRSDGIAGVALLPTALGTITVEASAVGRDTARASFTARTTALVIDNGYWGVVLGPGGSEPDVSVPVGTPIEWVNYYATPVRIRSSSAPTGGAPFDSRTLHEYERFRFVPGVPGMWEWTWEYLEYPSWAMQTGILTVQ